MERGQFTFYRSFFVAISRIRKKSARADIYDAVCRYALDGILPDMDKLEDAPAIVFDLIRPVLDAGIRRTGVYKEKKKNAGNQHIRNFAEQCSNNIATLSEHCCDIVVNEGEIEKEVEKENEIEIENECYTPEAFDVFWKAYPKKVNKAAARRAFAKVTVSLETLTRAVAKQKLSAQWQSDGGRYIPYPATWLNQRRWEDELPPDTKVPMGASGVLGEAELENIRRLLAE